MKHSDKQDWSEKTGPVSAAAPRNDPALSNDPALRNDPAPRRQVAALCYKKTKRGRKVLLITSRDTGRWIVPKGWPIEGKNGPESALQEAWEEAGVHKADIDDAPLGYYDYDKGLDDGTSIPVETRVYLTRVLNLKKTYPEVDERERAWFSPRKAADLVQEPDLKSILMSLA